MKQHILKVGMVLKEYLNNLERKVTQEFHGRNIGTAKTLSLQNQGNISHVNIQFKPLSGLNCEEFLSRRHDMALCPSQEHSASMKGAHVMLL